MVDPTPDATTAQSPATPLLALSKLQEQRLREHLDERLLALERDERKGQHALGPLSALTTRLTHILRLILQMPAREPWAAARVAYLLSFTAAAVRYMTSLPIVDVAAVLAAAERERARGRKRGAHERDGEENGEIRTGEESEGGTGSGTGAMTPEDPAGEQAAGEAAVEAAAGAAMRAALDLLAETERGWIAVLRGEAWVQTPTGGCAVPVTEAGIVDTTARVRLKSMVDIAREHLLAWARPYGAFGGEALGPDGDEGAVTPPEPAAATDGWEAEIVNVWRGILAELDWDDQARVVGQVGAAA